MPRKMLTITSNQRNAMAPLSAACEPSRMTPRIDRNRLLSLLESEDGDGVGRIGLERVDRGNR